MTRFARAKGSKSSNLKSPEDSTPWEVMKEQLLKSKKDIEESKNREEAEKQRIENYNNFLKEQKTQKRKATWCDFPEAEVKKKIKSNLQNNKHKKKDLSNEQQISSASPENNVNTCNEENKNKLQKKKKLNKDAYHTESVSKVINQDNHEDINDIKQNIVQTEQRSKKDKKKKKQNELLRLKPDNESELSTNNSAKTNLIDNNEKNHNIQKRKKKQNKKLKKESEQKLNQDNKESDNNIEDHPNNLNNSVTHKIETVKKKKNNKQKQVPQPDLPKEGNNNDNNILQQTNNLVSLKKKKDKTKKGRRKPVNDKSFQLIINSKEVDLIRFDGFPVMKKDAERLEELKKSMIKKGIPKSEVQRTMKLERRRAEKALARLKREVCYNCRKGGHNLSDCPDLKSSIPGVGAAEGVCFKCGSTEHRQFECKVQRDKEFRFATCFICKEPGHIARQCPDNPKGLYPNGGCCKLCGDVTHLRKDCPMVKDKKESSNIKLQTLNDDGIEDIGQNVQSVSEERVKKPKKIKF